VKTVKTESLVLDFTLYPRDEVSAQNVAALVEAYTLGNPVPPILVEAKSRRVVDGFHRVNALKKMGRTEADVVEKTYKNDGELFADAVRLNAAHGRAFDSDDRKRAVIKLSEFGFDAAATSEIVNVTQEKIAEWTKGWGTDPENHPVAVKGGLSHFAGRSMTKRQVSVNDGWSGMQPTFHINRLLDLLRADAWPKSDPFTAGMNALVEKWTKISSKRKRSA
jgi:hypothetical protein